MFACFCCIVIATTSAAAAAAAASAASAASAAAVVKVDERKRLIANDKVKNLDVNSIKLINFLLSFSDAFKLIALFAKYVDDVYIRLRKSYCFVPFGRSDRLKILGPGIEK
uniref:Secreted protein n=1 Tax=Glossina austeni TaxID=7395 RepID=A0A1A9VMT1_GLOAU